jgi:4-diphosphocytidyl-2-C-methyl-D-erythritol kinase
MERKSETDGTSGRVDGNGSRKAGMNSDSVTVTPCAKINLGLYVTGKRPDGYHTLETIFVPVAVFDRIDFTVTQNGIHFACNDPTIPVDDSNLIIRAVRGFYNAMPERPRAGLDISLVKSIPSGAGLGGGSSDAAYTLLALQRLFGNPLRHEKLHEIAVTIGADVPFFLESRVCLGEGIGEILTPLNIEIPGAILLVNPALHISTAEVFKAGTFALTNKNKLITMFHHNKLKNIFSLFPDLINELEPVVFSRYPVLRDIKSALQSSGALYAALTGSGSTLYGIFEGDQSAEKASRRFSPHYHTIITRQYVPRI